ncbi:response regulator [Stieleria varia]|nr:response regulator [Stieleria varia]
MNTASKKILIAEDNPGLARVLTFKIKSGGYLPLTCGDGREAWSVFEANPDIQAIISDQEMPYLTGIELFHRVRQVNQSIILFLVTGRQLELSQSSISDELNISQIFGKPFSPGALLSTLDAALACERASSQPISAPVDLSHVSLTDRRGFNEVRE